MFADYYDPTTENNQKDLPGLRISAVLLILLGCLFVLYALLCGLIICLSVIRHAHASEMPLWLLTLCLLCALSYLCYRAAKGLHKAQRWAAYVAIGFGLLLLWFSGSCIYDWFHPERQIPDEAFGILVIPILVAVGLWWCVYLNLPHVRAHLRACAK